MILNTSEAFKAGQDAYYRGMAKNRNPYNSKGVIANLERNAWNRGFEDAEKSANGV